MTTQMIGRDGARPAAALRDATDWLCLAAAPTFAAMALLTGLLAGGGQDMLCMAGQHASALGGMAWMYMLMSAFHAPPWLKLIAGRRGLPAGPDAA